MHSTLRPLVALVLVVALAAAQNGHMTITMYRESSRCTGPAQVLTRALPLCMPESGAYFTTCKKKSTMFSVTSYSSHSDCSGTVRSSATLDLGACRDNYDGTSFKLYCGTTSNAPPLRAQLESMIPILLLSAVSAIFMLT